MSSTQQQGAGPAAEADKASAPANFVSGAKQPYTSTFTHSTTNPTATTKATGPDTTVTTVGPDTVVDPHTTVVNTPTHTVTTTTHTSVTTTITTTATPKKSQAPASIPGLTIPEPLSTRPSSRVGIPTTTNQEWQELRILDPNPPGTYPYPDKWTSSANRPPFLGGMSSAAAWVPPYARRLRNAGLDLQDSDSDAETASFRPARPILGKWPQWMVKGWHKGPRGRWVRGNGSDNSDDNDDGEEEETGRWDPSDGGNGSSSGNNDDAIEERGRCSVVLRDADGGDEQG